MLVVDDTATPLVGVPFDVPPLTDAARRHLATGASVVAPADVGGPASGVVMTTQLVSAPDTRHLLVGAMSPPYLWGLDGLSTLTDLTVLDEAGRVLTSTVSLVPAFHERIGSRLAESSRGAVEWRDGESEEYLSSYWSLFLKARFDIAGWTIVLSEPLDYVLGPIVDFRNWFVWITLLSIWVVSLLSLIQIRRSLGPLEALREGTRRIAAREFDTRVTVTSDDEFEELAESFNGMAGRLGKQFGALKTINEIDNAVLSQLRTGDVVNAALARMPDILRCDAVAVGLLDPDSLDATVHLRAASVFAEIMICEAALDPLDVSTLQSAGSHLVERPAAADLADVTLTAVPGYLRPLAELQMNAFVTLPLRGADGLVGFVSLGLFRDRELDQDDLHHARQVSNQIAVALTNAQLVDKLDRFSWGALRTLARAIDAKSPWTAGHSERVTAMALRIGRALKLPADELDVLHRGGLLHDIGKIGVPPEILDKNGRLTDPEMEVMRSHVTIGAAILEPLESFADALPIVLEHHEWFNGHGYPKGLKGDELTLWGRIYAVADVFDAITSKRPYRDGMPLDDAIALIKRGSGKQFDPDIVEVFLSVTATEAPVIGATAEDAPSVYPAPAPAASAVPVTAPA